MSGELLVAIQDAQEEWLADQVMELLPKVDAGHEYSLLCGKARWAQGKPLSLVLPKATGAEPRQATLTAVVTDSSLQQEMDVQLVAAAEELDAEKVRSLLEAGASAAFVHDPPGTWGSKDTKSALHMAIQTRKGEPEQRDEVIGMLLDARADVNAVRASSDWRGCGSSQTAFEMVLQSVMTKPEQLQRWLDAGANPNTRSVQHVHSMRTDGEASKAVLHQACKAFSLQARTVDVVRTLLDAGAEVDAVEFEEFHNERGYNRHMKQTALHIACARGDLATAALLLARGADINKVREDLEHLHVETTSTCDDPREDDYECPVRCLPIRETALHLAIQKKQREIVALLVCAGADVTSRRRRDGEETSVQDICVDDEDLLSRLQARWPDAQALFSEEGRPEVEALMETLPSLA